MAGSPSEAPGGGVTGGPVKQVMSVKEGKGMFFFSVSVFSGSLA